MSIICAYQLDLEPSSDQTSKQLLGAVRDEVVTYLRTCLKDEQPQLTFAGITESLPAGHEVCSHEQFSENHGLATLVWEFPFGEKTAVLTEKSLGTDDSELSWQFSYTLACNARMVQVSLRCRVVTHSFTLRNVGFSLGEINPLHKVVVKLVEKWPCSAGGQAISNAVRTFGESDIRGFVDHSLFERKRVLPVIAFDRSPYVTEAFLAAFQRQMLGLGQVVALQDARATSRLTYFVGHERTCTGGVRVYWPGFSEKAASQAHHYYGYSSMQGTLTEKIYRLLAVGSARGFCEGRIIRAARAELGGDEPEMRTLTDLTVAEAKVQAALQERDRIQDQCQALQQQIGQLKAETKQALEDKQRCQNDSEVAREAVKSLQEAKKKATGLLAELQAQQKAVDKANRLAQDCRKETAEIQAQRERIRKERDAALAQVRSLQEELEQLRKAGDAAAHAEYAEHDHELYAELERAWDHIKRLQEEVAQGRRDMRELEAKVENYEKHWAPFQEGPDKSAEQSDQGVVTEQAFENVVGALRAAAAEFADVLTVWDDAWESAEESRYVSPANVYRALRAIAEVGREYFAVLSGSAALGPLEQAFHRRVPFKYTNFESKTTLGLYGDDRYFRKGQEARLMQRHLTMGGGQTNNCLQVYFDFDDESRRVIIGYCGRHLRYSRNRT